MLVIEEGTNAVDIWISLWDRNSIDLMGKPEQGRVGRKLGDQMGKGEGEGTEGGNEERNS